MEEQALLEEEEQTVDPAAWPMNPFPQPCVSTTCAWNWGTASSLISAPKRASGSQTRSRLRRQMAADVGFVMPSVRIQDTMQLPANGYVIRVKEIEAGNGDLRPNMMLVMDPRGEEISLPGEKTENLHSAYRPCGSKTLTGKKRCSVVYGGGSSHRDNHAPNEVSRTTWPNCYPTRKPKNS